VTDRIGCCIPGCGRTYKRQTEDVGEQIIMCRRHWNMGDALLRSREKHLRKRVRWFKRRWDRRHIAIDRSAKADKFYNTWQQASDAAHAAWHRVREDVEIKAAFGAEDAPRRRPRVPA
jgi:hypothetical protein